MIHVAPSGTFQSVLTGATTALTGTVGVRLINLSTAATTTARVTTGIVEFPAGSGIYIATMTAPAAEGRYLAVWDTGSVTPTTTSGEDVIVSANVDAYGGPDLVFLDVAVSSRIPTGGSATYAGPVALSGDITLVRGDDYNNADSRALTWTTSTDAQWPTLTGATPVTFTLTTSANVAEIATSATIVTATGAAKQVRVELTSAQTATLGIGGAHKFDIQATLASGRKVTLVRGVANVLEDLTT